MKYPDELTYGVHWLNWSYGCNYCLKRLLKELEWL